MRFQKKPLAASIVHALGVIGGTSLLVSLATTALADDATAASAPSAVAAPTQTSTSNSQASDNQAAVPADAPPANNQAQAPAPEAGSPAAAHRLGSVVVTAQRRAEKIQDVPSTVTAVSGNQIKDTNSGSSSANVTNFVANTSAGETSPSRPRWWIRGVGTGAQGFDVQSPVGVYFDDVYFSNASATGQPVFDLQRVEVLSGPQGTLWGKNTTGGAINFVSERPTFSPSGYVKLDQSSHDDQLVEAAFGGAIVDDKLAGRGSFHFENNDGAYKNSSTGQSEPQSHDDAGRVQFLLNATPDLSALLNVHFRDYYSSGNNWTVIGEGPNGRYLNAAAGASIPAISYTPSTDQSTVSTNALNTTQIRQDGVALTVNANIGRNTLTSITGFEGFQTTAFTDSDYTPVELGRSYQTGDTHQLSEELRLASPRSDQWNWVVGTMFFTEDINSNSVSAILPYAATGSTPNSTTPTFTDSLFTQNTKSGSIFGSSTYNFTDKFNVTGGLRYTNEQKSDNLRVVGASGTAGSATSLAPFSNVAAWWLPGSVSVPLKTLAVQDESKSWGAWTYDLTPEYKITDNARTYFRFAHGFRSGGFNSSAASQLSLNIVNPEYLTSYEWGAKSEWLDGRLIANGDVFYYNYNDIQINVVAPVSNGLGGFTNVSTLTNAGKGKASGAEFTLEALPVENLHLRWNAGWLNTKFEDYTTGGVSYAGNHFVRSPHLSDVFSADYRLPLANGDDIILATDWKYQSKYYFYSNNQTDPAVAQTGYTVGDARVSYVVGKITYTAYVQNLTDKIYKAHTLLESGAGISGDAVSWSEGRIFGASFSTKW